ncbi:MAG: HD domain-containing protein [Rikenellaceae bacterium]|nr:HD domain-containing protein [Rikenellaceae bacterium]
MEHFIKELSFIKDDKIRQQTEKLLESVAPEFFQAAASSTGKYHPSYALGEGGLYRHTCAAVGIAADLLGLECYQNKFDDNARDYIIAAIILHDSCKSGICWDSKYTKHDHPIQAAKFVEMNLEGEENEEFVSNVSRLVASHMGQWNVARWDRTVLPKPEQEDEIFVHTCDYLASRKYLEYKFEEEENG